MKYLSESDLIELNSLAIAFSDLSSPHAVLDSSSLSSVVNTLKQSVFGVDVHPTLVDKASVLYIMLVKKHIFADANKRTALLALDTFLMANGCRLKAVRSNPLFYADLTVYIAVTPYTSNLLSEVRSMLRQRMVKL